MSGEITVPLQDGLKIGETTIRELTVRAPSAGALIDGQVAAERPVTTPQGLQLMVSPTLLEAEVVRRQVVRLGDNISGPMELSDLKRLSQRDFTQLVEKAEGFDRALAQDLAARGE